MDTAHRDTLHRDARPTALWAATALLLTAALVVTALPAVAQGTTLRGLGGETLREADLTRGSTIVVVWASWSPRGKDVDGKVNSLVDRWGGRARVVTVNFQEDEATVREFLAGKNMRAPVFLDPDGAFSKKNAVTNLPGLLVIKDGETAFRGKLPDDPDSVISPILG